MDRQPLQLLRSVFGYDGFRGEQEAIINHVIAGGDALVLMPTGGGKSICYQIPALLRPGIGIVISPLISLMQDQVDALLHVGVRAAFLNSSLDQGQMRRVEREMLSGELDLVYAAPERLMTERFLELLAGSRISLFAIDEAHCVSHWGHDFRPEYMQLNILHQRFPEAPRIALTATADVLTRREIVERLSLSKARIFVSGFDRPNIYYQVAPKRNAKAQLLTLLETKHSGDAGIVYCLSRKRTEEISDWLVKRGWNALPYHAGLESKVRRLHQERFQREEGVVIVATVAFGMGIDKSNVRFVAHLDVPKSLEAYYQETGRAGRDSLPATAWMAYSLGDVMMLHKIMADSDADEKHKRIEEQKLKAVPAYCETSVCRRQVLLNYFGESFSGPCGNCDNCLEPQETWDGTQAAQKALSCVYRTGQRFGVAYLIDVLLGKSTERVRRFGHDQVSTFGVGTELTKPQWHSIFRQLLAMGLLRTDIDGPGGLQLMPESRAVLSGARKVHFRKDAEPQKQEAKQTASSLNLKENGAQELWDALRACRRQLAAEHGVAPYIIFHDSVLMEMVRCRPQRLEDLGCLSGVGAFKLERYGKLFLEALESHAATYGLPENLPPLPYNSEPSLKVTESNGLSETESATLELLRQGMTVEKIAAARKLKPNTVYGHLARAIEEGDIELHEAVSLSEDEMRRIKSAILAQPEGERHILKPTFEALQEAYDYNILRCVLAEIKRR